MSEMVRLERQSQLHREAKEIQAFGEVRLMPIGLSSDVCVESTQLLNQILADSIILHSLYLLLDKHATEQEELIDLLAERVQTLGAVAVADPRHVAELTRIERPPNGIEEVPAMLSRLLAAHEVVIDVLRAVIDKTADNLDWGTNDLLVGDVLRTNEEQVWFVAEHLVDTPSIRQ